ncbi:hypothetical protein EX895_002070 [Sporisorium graminicola]|uniref:Ketoreductase domain-containing protein n=1 Tax=Sporisorium graminicola TaxID=280036 RepID=A0A4V6EU16_9BASI|nr:hypothetical protein EX895_002070 [Sporisorium graminicola]TKY88829.1 hypothetical protein EX895_002070 [Sporisorium graminicola]
MAGKTFLITGCSSGLGAALAKQALSEGHIVLATARGQQGTSAQDRLKELADAGAVTGHLDVTEDADTVKQSVDALVSRSPSKTVDVLINNAGYILQGGVEECSLDEIQGLFEVNVLGAVRVLQAVLPYMRAQRSGVVAMFGSLGGWIGYPGSGYYSATKASCSLIAEALRDEVSHLGIQVTSIEPGRFRTAFLTEGKGRVVAQRQLPDLDPVMDYVRQGLHEGDLQQPGDPDKAARLVVECLTQSGRCAGKEIPYRLPLGPDALQVIGQSADRIKTTIETWRELSSSTDL